MSKGEKWTITIGVLGLLGITLQLWIAVIHEQEHRAGTVSTITSICVWLVVGAVNVYAIVLNLRDSRRLSRYKAEVESKKPEIESLIHRRKRAGAQAALLENFSLDATDLLSRLEATWHHWNNAGERLIHPISGKLDEIKNWGKDNKAGDLVTERRDLMLLHWRHVSRAQVDIPFFSSPLLQLGYPSEAEYQVLHATLKEHINMLAEAAKQVWDSGKPMDTSNDKAD